MDEFDFSVRQIDEQRYFGVERDCPRNAIGDTIVASATEIDTALKHNQGWIHGELVVNYEVLSDTRIRLRVGRPAIDLDSSTLPSDLREFALPAGPIASHVHKGPYMGIFQATMRLMDACKSNGHQLIGGSWEIYHHITQPNDPTASETTIFFRIITVQS